MAIRLAFDRLNREASGTPLRTQSQEQPPPIPMQNPLVTRASQGLPLEVPWGAEAVLPGRGFDSRGLLTHPWVVASPFTRLDLDSPCMVYHVDSNAQASYRSAESSVHEVSTAHYSGSVGATVDCKFASASVTGSYDKTVQENRDSLKVSRGASYRAGLIEFAQEPALDHEAQRLLATQGGEAAFRARYGDYYVAGLVLGADSGAFMSVDTSTTTTTETVALTVTVKVLFFKPKTWTTSETSVHTESSLNFTCCGFDTLAGTSLAQAQTSLLVAHDQVMQYTALADALDTRLQRALEGDLRLRDRETLTLARCEDVCRAKVVFQLLLMPFSTLRGYKVAIARRS